MKFLVLYGSIILILLSCAKDKKHHERLLNDLMIVELYQRIKPMSCRDSYGQPNTLLNFSEYYTKFTNTNTYTNIILGDSTMDISTRYEGFLSSHSYSLAIGGNTACDVLEQLAIVNVKTENVMYSTNDGNGGLRSIDINTIRKTNNDVINTIRTKFNPKVIVVILLHPTMLSNFEEKRITINNNFIIDNTGVCYILPDNLFTLVNGIATEKDMLDSIHYNKDVSFKIKELVKEKCNIEL